MRVKTDNEIRQQFKRQLLGILRDNLKLFKERKQIALNLIDAHAKSYLLTDKEIKLCQYYL